MSTDLLDRIPFKIINGEKVLDADSPEYQEWLRSLPGKEPDAGAQPNPERKTPR